MAYTLLRCSCGIALSIKFLRRRHSDLDYTGTPFQEIHLEILVRTAAAMAAQDGGTIQCQNHDSSLYSKLKKIYVYIWYCIFGWFFGMIWDAYLYALFSIMNTAGCFSFGSPTTWVATLLGNLSPEEPSCERTYRPSSLVDLVLMVFCWNYIYIYYRQWVPHLLLEWDRIVRHECVFVAMFFFFVKTLLELSVVFVEKFVKLKWFPS